MRGQALPIVIVIVLALLLCTSCTRTVYEAHFAPPSQVGKLTEAASRAPFLKCHMSDGRVFVLQEWSIEEGAGTVEGFGIEYTADRDLVGDAHRHRLKLDEIALIETSRPYSIDVGTGSVISMIIGTTLSAGFTIGCLASVGHRPCWLAP